MIRGGGGGNYRNKNQNKQNKFRLCLRSENSSIHKTTSDSSPLTTTNVVVPVPSNDGGASLPLESDKAWLLCLPQLFEFIGIHRECRGRELREERGGKENHWSLSPIKLPLTKRKHLINKQKEKQNKTKSIPFCQRNVRYCLLMEHLTQHQRGRHAS